MTGATDEMVTGEPPAGAFVVLRGGCVGSTRSDPVSRNSRNASTTMSAVMPKEITIAVNTSACGSGSA
jgi:hypothetical protein